MYLQPLRYLWTIAAEERLLAPVCADSQIFLEAEVLFTYKVGYLFPVSQGLCQVASKNERFHHFQQTKTTERCLIATKTPCLIPELQLLDKVH